MRSPPTDKDSVGEIQHPEFFRKGAQHEAQIYEDATNDSDQSVTELFADEIDRYRWINNIRCVTVDSINDV